MLESSRVPIVVDLDGTLVATDMLVESASAWVARNPLRAPRLLAWLASGRAALKAGLAGSVSLDVTVLPYRTEVIDWLTAQREQGRPLILASASDERWAREVADHLGLFDEVLATSAGHNLKGAAKRDLLVERFGEGGYEYLGDHAADRPVWRSAAVAHAVGHVATPKGVPTGQRFGLGHRGKLRGAIRALRPHQWVKNALVALPLFTAQLVDDSTARWHALVAVIAFSLVASGVYVLNDIADVTSDRHHPKKQRRPFASGRLSLITGWLMWPALTAIGFIGAALLLPGLFLVVLAAYLLLTLAYTFWAKRRPVLDVISLGGLYTIRIVAGAAAISVPLSMWLLTFSLLLFLSLALVKRVSELTRVRREGTTAVGRGYVESDLELLSSYGVATSIGAVVIFALYVNDPTTATLYQTPELLWFAVPVLLAWLMRAWLWAHRGEMSEDPIVFAIRDPKSILAGVAVIAAFVAAATVGG